MNDFRLSDMGPDGDANYGAFNPAVAYNSTTNEYLVVWGGDDNTGSLAIDEFEVYGQRVDAATGVEIEVNDFRLSDMGPDGDANYIGYLPAIAYNSTNNEYLVVWFGEDNTAPLVDGEREIFGQRISATGTEIGSNDFRLSDMGPDGNPNYDVHEVWVAYNGTNNEYLVVWQGDDNAGSLVDGEVEIFGQRVNAATGAEIGVNDFRLSDMGPDGLGPPYSAFQPEIAYNSINNQYLVIWRGVDNTPPLVAFECEIFGQRVDGATGLEIGGDTRLSDMGPDGDTTYGYPFDFQAIAYNSTNNEYLVAWDGEDNIPPLVNEEFEILGQRVSGTENSVYLPLLLK